MLALLGPIQIAVVMLVVLVVFGPEKVKDLGRQLGRVLRDVRKAGSEFTNIIHGDENHYDNGYNPPRYDSYGNAYDTPSSTVPDEDVNTYTPAIEAAKSEVKKEPPRGDFAAAALSDSPSDYTSGHTPSSNNSHNL